MKTRIIVLIFAAMMMVACGGGGKSSSSCSHGGNKKCGKATAACAGEKSCSMGATACASQKSCSMGATACAGEKACSQKASACPNSVKKIISAQVFIKPDKVDTFLAATKSLVEKSRAEEGCISYTLYQDPQDKTKFLFFEEWKNQAAVDFHFSTEHFQKFGETLNECASAPAIITVYDSSAEKKM